MAADINGGARPNGGQPEGQKCWQEKRPNGRTQAFNPFDH
jgi:hypothetical protein